MTCGVQTRSVDAWFLTTRGLDGRDRAPAADDAGGQAAHAESRLESGNRGCCWGRHWMGLESNPRVCASVSALRLGKPAPDSLRFL